MFQTYKTENTNLNNYLFVITIKLSLIIQTTVFQWEYMVSPKRCDFASIDNHLHELNAT